MSTFGCLESVPHKPDKTLLLCIIIRPEIKIKSLKEFRPFLHKVFKMSRHTKETCWVELLEKFASKLFHSWTKQEVFFFFERLWSLFHGYLSDTQNLSRSSQKRGGERETALFRVYSELVDKQTQVYSETLEIGVTVCLLAAQQLNIPSAVMLYTPVMFPPEGGTPGFETCGLLVIISVCAVRS